MHKITQEQYTNWMIWVAALRSGDYKQGIAKLKQRKDSSFLYCCHGVAAELFGAEENNCDFMFNDGHWSAVSPNTSWFVEKFGFVSHHYEDIIQYLYTMNDGGKTFDWIADYIENEILTECEFIQEYQL